MMELPPDCKAKAFVRSLLSPTGLIILLVSGIAVAQHVSWAIGGLGLFVYALIVSRRYARELRGPRGKSVCSRAAVKLAPQYRAWNDHARDVCSAVQDMAATGPAELQPLWEPVLRKAQEMAGRLYDISVEAQRLYQYLLAYPPSGLERELQGVHQQPGRAGGSSLAEQAIAGQASAPLQNEARRTVVFAHGKLVETAESILSAMDDVRAKMVHIAAGQATADNGAIAAAVQKLDEMRAAADAVEQVVARTQAQVASL